MSINSLLTDPGSKPWADLYVDTLTCYSGLNVRGTINFSEGTILTEHLQAGPPNTFLHTNLLNEVVWEPIGGSGPGQDIDADQITGGMDGQILRYQSPGGTQWFDKILNSNLPDSINITNSISAGANIAGGTIASTGNISSSAGISASGTISGATLEGNLDESYITPGLNGQYLVTTGGVATWGGITGAYVPSMYRRYSTADLATPATTAMTFDIEQTYNMAGEITYSAVFGSFTILSGRWFIECKYNFSDISADDDYVILIDINGGTTLDSNSLVVPALATPASTETGYLNCYLDATGGPQLLTVSIQRTAGSITQKYRNITFHKISD